MEKNKDHFEEIMADLKRTILPAVEAMLQKKAYLMTRRSNLQAEELSLTKEAEEVAQEVEKEQTGIISKIAAGAFNRALAKKARELRERGLEIPILLEGIREAIPAIEEEMRQVDEEIWINAYGPFSKIATQNLERQEGRAAEMALVATCWQKAVRAVFAEMGIKEGAHPWRELKTEKDMQREASTTALQYAQAALIKRRGDRY